MRLNQLGFILPFMIFAAIVVVLWRGLQLHPDHIPSPFINKAAPGFALPDLFNSKKIRTEKELAGQVTLVNVWATWCTSCAEEHTALLALAREQQVLFFGWNYKDDPLVARDWLKQHGNPYFMTVMDGDGRAAIDWGVYGTPETFVVDKKGVIRYRHIGPIDAEVWENTLKPLLETLRKTPA